MTVAFDLPSWGLVLRDVRAGGSLGGRGRWRARPDSPSRSGAPRPSAAAGSGSSTAPTPSSCRSRTPASTGSRRRRTRPTPSRLEASAVTTGRSTLALTGTFTGVYGLSARLADAGPRARGAVRRRGGRGRRRLAGRARLGWTPPSARARASRFGSTGRSRGCASRPRSSRRRSGALAADATLDGGAASRAGRPSPASAGRAPAPAAAPFASGTLDGTIRGRFDLDAGRVAGRAVVVADATGGAGAAEVRARPGGGRARGSRRRGGAGRRGRARSVGHPLRRGGDPVAAPHLRAATAGASARPGSVAIRDARERAGCLAPRRPRAARPGALAREPARRHVRPRRRPTSAPACAARFATWPSSWRSRRAPRLTVARRALRAAAADRAADRRRRRARSTAFASAGPGGSAARCLGAGRRCRGGSGSAWPCATSPSTACRASPRRGLPIAGRVSGELRLAGGPPRPAVSGRLALDAGDLSGAPGGRRGGDDLARAARRDPRPRAARRGDRRRRRARAAGRRACRATPSSSSRSSASIRSSPELPGGITATSVLSGRVVARVAPGRPAEAEGWLSELTLVVSPPPAAGADGPPDRAARRRRDPLSPPRRATGRITIGPARFRGNVGAFELSGESRGDDLRGTLRGRIDLAPFAPLAAPWLDRLAGAIDVDLAAARIGAKGALTVDGSVSVAAPLAFRLASLPVRGARPLGPDPAARYAPSRRPRSRSACARSAWRRARSAASRRTSGSTPTWAARRPPPPPGPASSIDRFAAEVPAVGPRPIRGEHGTVAARAGEKTLELTAIDLPFRGEARGISAAGAPDRPGRASRRACAAILAGSSTLSGDVQIDAARIAARRHRGAGRDGAPDRPRPRAR